MWTHYPSKTFWPTLLHEDKRFSNAQILSFGYDATYDIIFAPKNALGIPDFAKQFLDTFDLHYDEYHDVVNNFTEAPHRLTCTYCYLYITVARHYQW